MAESFPVTECRDLSKVYTKRPQNRNSAHSKLRQIHALDTETYKGDIFLIADSDGRYLDKITPESVIKWLFCKKYHGSWNFFYNLSYDAEVILKLLGSELYRYRFTGKLDFWWGDYHLEYFPGKSLRIKKGHHSVLFFDIMQFFGGSLSNAYQKNIGELSSEYLSMKEKRKEFTLRFYNHNKKKIRNYCIQDCKFTKELSEKWITLFSNAFSFYPAKWTSAGYLAEKVLINNGINLPRFVDTPYPIQELAFKSYFGGRIELIKRGYIGKAYLYDINSAYPDAIAHFPDLSKGKWIKRKSIHADTKLGFFKVLCDIPDDSIVAPFPFKTNNVILYPSGKFVTYCTLSELQACKKNLYRILEGYQFISTSDIYPYRKFIQSLYQKRQKLKKENNPLEQPIKIILNSIYGKTGQKINGVMGNLFNPVMFAFITGYTRAKLYEFVTRNRLEGDIVAFATDSICTTKKLNLDSKRLGDFSYDGESQDTFYLQNGFYRFNGIWKQRGLGRLGSKEIEHLDTFEKDGKLFYKFNVLRNSRLRSSILSDRIQDIGKIAPITREVNLNADRKRLWLGTIESIDQKECNDSMSISLNYIQKITI
ncbi:DNA polymerase [Nitrosopumilus cobalaminigenes]|uniref:DNA-directed DNA polymerase n=1 Tax=Nitrosopumilus cobalaminigenes TaxID=1470066 RepID=A0A7D5QZ37_9ARCH|nr:DNA polymerase [Nitrosopumilus cobalaminigenes]QLH03000.1 DNA polymerase [Nitrosopumilus cobalaminigenes]